MKKLLFLGFLSAICSSNLLADTAYWTGIAPTSNTSESGSWKNTDNWSTGAIPDSTTDVVFDAAHYVGYYNPDTKKTIGWSAYMDNVATVKSVFIAEDYRSWLQLRINGTFNVLGDFITENKSVTSASGASAFISLGANSSAAIVNIGGNMVVGDADASDTSKKVCFVAGALRSNEFGSWGGPQKLTIGQNLTMYNAADLFFNVSLVGKTVDYSNPDVDIGGIINMVAGTGAMSGKNPNLYVVYRTNKSDTQIPSAVTCVVSSKGITGNGVITNDSSASITKGVSTAILHLKNESTYTFSGWVADGTNAVTKIVMDGTGTQRFTSGNASSTTGLAFSGGVEMISGNLEIQYANQLNHGDLTMKGGKFGNVFESTSYNVNFTNLDYSGGTIVARVSGAGVVDVITLSGGLIKNASFVSGTEKFLIELTGDLTSIVGESKKIISWDNSTNATDFAATDFEATALSGYNAEFSILDDGLYLQYIAVPEPATFAAIFGAIALAFAIRRRK